MAYNNSIPQPTDKLSTSQNDIYGNFQALGTFTAIDHVQLNAANQGMHAKVTFPIAAAPAANTAGFIGLYGANDLSGNPQIYVNNVAPALQIPMTASLKANPGWTYLPSGLIMQWVSGTISGSSSTANLAIAFPTAMLTVQVSPAAVPSGDPRDAILTATASGLSAVSVVRSTSYSGTSVTYNVLAIGY